MKILTTQSDLAYALRTVAPAIGANNSHPILGCVLLETQHAGSIALTGYNMDIGIKIVFPAMVEKEGAMAMPYKLLSGLVAKFDNNIAIAIDGEKLNADNASYKIPTESAEDYPHLPIVEGSATELQLSAGVKACLPCISKDASKQILQGMHLANGYIEATDGHRMMRYALELPENIDLVLPAATMKLIQDRTVRVSAAKGQAVISTDDDITIYSHIFDGKYPDLKSLIPQKYDHCFEVDRHRLLRCLERVAIVAEQHNSVIKIEAKQGELIITADADSFNGKEVMPFFGDAEGFWAFNVHYILDALKAFRQYPEVLISANSATTPVIIKPKAEVDQTYLVMPVQVRQP